MVERLDYLRITGLSLGTADRELLSNVDIEVRAGTMVALVGASGAGKSLTARAILGQVPPGITRISGHAALQHKGQAYAWPIGPAAAVLQHVRGRAAVWIPQDAHAALAPVYTVERQLRDALRHARRSTETGAILDLLERVGLGNPSMVARAYPHQLSGGMARRVQVALGLATGASFLLADEPTTGLDRPVQARLMETFRALVDAGAGVLLIGHDLPLLDRFADEMVVLADGQVVANGPVAALRDHPAVARLRGDAA